MNNRYRNRHYLKDETEAETENKEIKKRNRITGIFSALAFIQIFAELKQLNNHEVKPSKHKSKTEKNKNHRQ